MRCTGEVGDLHKIVSAGAADASAQQVHELQRLQREEREQLLRDAGIAPKALCALGAGLALQADLHMPWHKLRKLCRWLSSFGVSLESESTMRQQISQQLPFTISAELVPSPPSMGQ